MKKTALVALILGSLALSACTREHTWVQVDNGYKAEVLFSAYEGNNLKLTLRKNDCDNTKDGEVEKVTLTQAYDSDLVVGACVSVVEGENGVVVDNISRTKSRSWWSRTAE